MYAYGNYIDRVIEIKHDIHMYSKYSVLARIQYELAQAKRGLIVIFKIFLRNILRLKMLLLILHSYLRK